MICIATKRKLLAKTLKRELLVSGIKVKSISLEGKDFLKSLYDPHVSSIITDDQLPGIPPDACADILNALALRLPIIVLQKQKNEPVLAKISPFHQLNSQVTIISPDQEDIILSTLKLFGSLGRSLARPHSLGIPLYNGHIPTSVLLRDSALGILTIDASGLSRIGVDYGPEVYNTVKEVFNNLLFSMWGLPGCFRRSDIVCRKSFSSNIYYVFLSKSRATGSLPLPGSLEKAADRIASFIHNSMWGELFANDDQRKIPACVKALPLVGVGFFGVMNNHCIDPSEILEKGLESSRQVAQTQIRRIKDRQRELIQTLVASKDLLSPHFQAVFHLPDITEQDVKDSAKAKSIGPLNQFLFGFESLIRVDKESVEAKIKEHGILDLDPKFLRPDVLFAMAKAANVALELDQTCLKFAAAQSHSLPGIIMVNILPRNLYHVDQLISVFNGRENIIFEVSESEEISNYDLVMRARNFLEKHLMGIAIDDFGSGYSSLESIIRIRPNIIKFDRSLIQDIHEDPIKQAYVKGLIEAGKFLHTLVLAEGIEKWEEARVLQDLGVDLIQGYLFHRPQTVKNILNQVHEPVLKRGAA